MVCILDHENEWMTKMLYIFNVHFYVIDVEIIMVWSNKQNENAMMTDNSLISVILYRTPLGNGKVLKSVNNRWIRYLKMVFVSIFFYFCKKLLFIHPKCVYWWTVMFKRFRTVQKSGYCSMWRPLIYNYPIQCSF